MVAVLHGLQYAVAIAYIVLGAVVLVQWLRERDVARGYLALAIGGLGVVAALGQVQPLLQYREPWSSLFEDIALVAFMASGLGVLLFRSSFIPLSRPVLTAVVVAAGAIALFAVAVNLPTNPSVKPSPVQYTATAALILLWSLLVGEPIVRFWLASMGRPRVQRSRMRALSLGFAGLVGIILVSVLAASAVRSTAAQVVIELVALSTVPLLYASFSPPTWLRRTWREREEVEYRRAIQDLVLFSPTRQALAEKAVHWGARLVGADAAVLFDVDGSAMAEAGTARPEVVDHVRALAAPSSSAVVQAPGGERETVVVVGLPTSQGEAKLAVVSGPFTPVFGSDEISRLEDYSSAVTAGLDRTTLTERLAALERTKTQFLNLASHELRGPVTVLRGYLSMLERGTLPPEQARTVLPVLVAKTEEMNMLVDQMIEASRLEEGRLELHTERLDLRDVASRAVDLARPLADSQHPLALKTPQEPVVVEADAERLGTIVTNLLDNAIKYSPAGGQVVCRVDRNGTSALLSVSDQGVGIREDQMPHLFTRFGRIVTSETSSIRGTGLGLYLARELARLHGGDITVESQPGRGSTFVVAVPLAD